VGGSEGAGLPDFADGRPDFNQRSKCRQSGAMEMSPLVIGHMKLAMQQKLLGRRPAGCASSRGHESRLEKKIGQQFGNILLWIDLVGS